MMRPRPGSFAGPAACPAAAPTSSCEPPPAVPAPACLSWSPGPPSGALWEVVSDGACLRCGEGWPSVYAHSSCGGLRGAMVVEYLGLGA